MISLDPVRILKLGAEEEKAEHARLSNFLGAIVVGDVVKSTLGPKGMDKMLVSYADNGRIMKVTNDGATILKGIGFDNPAAKILVNMASAQDDLVGDGTTSVAILASELLRESEMLIAKKIHPQTIISGFRLASKIALNALEASALNCSDEEEIFRNELVNLAKTCLSSKILNIHKDKFSKISVDAVLRLKCPFNFLSAIHTITIPGGSLDDSFLDEGFLLARPIGKFQPRRIEKAKILLANTGMDADKPKSHGLRARVSSLNKLANLEEAEKASMKKKVDKILKHGCNVFINRQQIYNYPEQLFADAGVMSIELAQFEGIEGLALVTGGEIASTFDDPENAKLGECDLVEEVLIGEEKLLRLSGVKLGEACTIVIRGATRQITAEAERAVHDSLCVVMAAVKERKMVCGGGAAEMQMSMAVSEIAAREAGKEAVAMESFAKALLQLPTAISDNSGFDTSFLLSALRVAHFMLRHTFGLNMQNGNVACMQELGVLEPLAVKRQMINSATEATEVILRIDHILKAEPRKCKEKQSLC